MSEGLSNWTRENKPIDPTDTEEVETLVRTLLVEYACRNLLHYNRDPIFFP